MIIVLRNQKRDDLWLTNLHSGRVQLRQDAIRLASTLVLLFHSCHPFNQTMSGELPCKPLRPHAHTFTDIDSPVKVAPKKKVKRIIESDDEEDAAPAPTTNASSSSNTKSENGDSRGQSRSESSD